MNDFYLILKNITRNKLRLIFNLFAIFIAFFIFGVLGSVERAFNAGIELSADDRIVTINKINFIQPLPYSYVQKVKAIEGVKLVTHSNWFGAYIKDSKHFFAGLAVDPETYVEVYADFIDVPEDQAQAWLRNRQGALVGRTLADMFGWKVGDRIPVSSNIFSQKDGSTVWDMVVEGIFDGVDTNFMAFHYEYFNETQSWGGDLIGWITTVTDDPSLNEVVAKKIDKQFENSFYETKTSSEKQFNKAFIEQIGSIGLIISLVVGAAFVTILMIVGNTMVLAIRERMREIAVLKTLGFSASRIFQMVLSESLLVAFIGGLLGLVTAQFTVVAMANVPNIKSMMPTLMMDSSVVVPSLMYMFALGLLTGIIPAYRAMQLNIIEALSRR